MNYEIIEIKCSECKCDSCTHVEDQSCDPCAECIKVLTSGNNCPRYELIVNQKNTTEERK
jgi:hypothetical protein